MPIIHTDPIARTTLGIIHPLTPMAAMATTVIMADTGNATAADMDTAITTTATLTVIMTAITMAHTETTEEAIMTMCFTVEGVPE